MKILLIGSIDPTNQEYTYASSFKQALTELNHDVTTITTWKKNKKKSFITIINQYISNILLNKKIKTIIKKNNFEYIFFIKASRISAKTIAWIKKQSSARLIHFYPDNPFVFWNNNSNAEVLKSLPFFDYWLSWSHMLIPALLSAGCKQVEYFPFAFDASLFNKEIIISIEDKKKYTCTVSFIGTWEPSREKWLTNLIKKMPSLDLKIWGNLWQENLTTISPLKSYIQGPAIYGTTMIKALRCATINLNFIRTQNATAHNMRTFEIPASGAFMLTERTKEQTEYPFCENKNVVCFGSENELLEKILFYAYDDISRKMIAAHGLDAVQNYTITAQLNKLFDRLKEMR